MGLAPEPEGEAGREPTSQSPRAKRRPGRGAIFQPPPPRATPRREGIVWLAATGNSAVSPAAAPKGRPVPPRPAGPGRADGPKGRFLLWVDAVGGYLVCLDDRIILGRAGPDSPADVPLMGDLSRNHATLIRSGESYVLQAHHSSFVNGKPVTDQNRAPRRRRDPPGLDRGAGVPPAQPGQRHGPAGHRQPAPASPGRGRRAAHGRDLHRRRLGPGAYPGPALARIRSSSIARATPFGAGPRGALTLTAEPAPTAPP